MAAFGWSAGDLAAAIGVIWTVCESLKSAGGASDSYQESLGFLQGLHGTLKRLHDVNDRNLSSDDRNFIKSQLHLIQKPVDKFAQNIISRYGSDLGEKPTGKALRKWIIGSAKKVAWALLKEADKLRDEISLPLLSIQLCELYQIQLITCQLRDQLPTEISNHIITNIGNKFPNLLEQYIDPLRSHAVAQAQLQEDRDKRIKELLVEIPQDMKKLHRESDYRTQQVIGDAAELSKQTKAFLGEKIDQLPNQIVKDMNALTRATELQASMTLKTVQRMENALQENIFDVKALKSALIYKASPSEPEWEGQKLIKSGSKSGQTLMEVKMHFKELCLLLARLVRELLEQLWPLIAPIFLHLKTLQCYIAHVPSFLLNDNITFIDAFNRPRSLPYGTYRNWGTFTRFLQTSFEGIPGNRQIMDDNFWLTDNMGRTIDQSNWECSVRPKAQISMSIILDNWVIRDCCPKCRTKIGPASHMPNKLLKCTGQGCGLEIYLASASTTFMTQMTKRAAQRPEFPVSYEISRSVQYFKGLHSREQARENYKHLVEPGETLIQEQHIDNYKNIHNEYAHLVLAEQRKGFSPPGEFVWDVVKQEEDRKAEAFELQKYFRRVLFVGRPTPRCKICSFSNFTYYDDINRHMVIEHTHIFVCIFRFAGCNAKFTNKAQWKCHVTSEHLNWVCGERTCPNKKDSPINHYWKQNYIIFSKAQKKSFYQSLRSRAQKALEALGRYEKIPLVKLGCPLRDCKSQFEGEHCWDKRMEHIAMHIKDNVIYVEEYPCGDFDFAHSDDHLFMNWVLSENIVGRTARGKFWLQEMDS